MLLRDVASASHILQTISLDTFVSGKYAVMLKLRQSFAAAFLQWEPENVLNFVLAANMNSFLGGHRDQWNPLSLLRDTGFGVLTECESVLAFEEEPNGDATLRVAFTEASRDGRERQEPLVKVPRGGARLFFVRDRLVECFGQPGNGHWGTEFDVKSLSDALGLGILLFRNRWPSRPPNCLYPMASERTQFPYWIALWWEEPVHFRMAEIRTPTHVDNVGQAGSNAPSCFWSADDLPRALLEQYRCCNRLAP